jgi:DNA-directed RNA polymerase subunit RPC12/RpoP
MSDLNRTDATVKCKACGQPMTCDLYIAPLGKADGMAMYVCAACDKIESRFIPPPLRATEGR